MQSLAPSQFQYNHQTPLGSVVVVVAVVVVVVGEVVVVVVVTGVDGVQLVVTVSGKLASKGAEVSVVGPPYTSTIVSTLFTQSGM
jgi:hypothetical protein